MSLQDFVALPLHDAVLGTIEVVWQEKLIRMRLAAFVSVGQRATEHQLEFHGVSHVVLPHSEPWGPSSSVLAGSQAGSTYQLQMQSGDNIVITANGFSFVAL
eukprot:TRINITY_DN14469_c0_g1_i1.p1 TRINITY_DN14469_c0_g1~~TRINITY_DN14469_c0_g1_i1.p1  ORF type:complete len:102 (-),score=18.05 TRINITY_DN14469_c0_g1_i1:120-425(-)